MSSETITTEAAARPCTWVHEPSDGTFRKTLPTPRAHIEHAGWRRLRGLDGLLPVPDLLERRTTARTQTLVYEDVFARGRCDRLLGDAISQADADPARAREVTAMINAICGSWLASADRTGAQVALADCVPALYAERLRPGGRLDTWYGARPPIVIVTPARTIRLDLPVLLTTTRTALTGGARWPSAITQGDPTEPNIAQSSARPPTSRPGQGAMLESLCWLDCEHAGRNTLAGEAANLLWYLLGMGGWLVPAYQPITYARTLRVPGPGARPPRVTHLLSRRSPQAHIIELDHRLRAGPGRRAALDALLARLHTDLGARLSPRGHTLWRSLAPWLALRILGVFPLTALHQVDAAACLAQLGLTQTPEATVTDFAATVALEQP